jgi:hypothetical protein
MAGANFAILALALKEKTQISLIIALLPTVVTSIGYLWLLSFVYSAFRIATYIREVLEPKVGQFAWEGWIRKTRESHGAPVDRYRLVCRAFYIISLGTAIVKLATLFNPLALQEMKGFWLRFGALLISWFVWLLAAHLLLIRRTSRRIMELYYGTQKANPEEERRL